MFDLYPKEVTEILNDLLRDFFKCNSTTDNMAYALQCELNCNAAGDYYHHHFAHVFPSDVFADGLSDLMVKSGIRPVRKGFEGDTELYDNIAILFNENYDMIVKLRDKIVNAIDFLDYDKNNKQIVIKLEEILTSCMEWVRICFIWKQKAEEYYNANDTKKFDIDFEDFYEFDD